MMRALMVLGVAVASVPLLFVLAMMSAVRWPSLDAKTANAPEMFRTMVADTLMQGVGFGKDSLPAASRAVKINPENGAAWTRLCTTKLNDDDAPVDSKLSDCLQSNRYDHTKWSEYRVARVYEMQGRECDAQAQYEKANNTGGLGENGYTMMEAMGRSSLRCGRELWAAKAELINSIELIDKDLKSPDADDEDADEERNDQLQDRKYLSVALADLHDPAGARDSCLAVDKSWKSCSCSLDTKGQVSCEGK